jgi:hypothetical protein
MRVVAIHFTPVGAASLDQRHERKGERVPQVMVPPEDRRSWRPSRSSRK